MIQRPYASPGIGWLLAIVAALMSLLILFAVVAVTPAVVGALGLLLAAALLL